MGKEKFYSVTLLKKAKEKNPIPIVENLIHDYEISLITAGPKSGKTTLALSMADAISKGDDFLGRHTIKSKVLYISLDSSSNLIGQRLHRMKFSDNENLLFYFDSVSLGNENYKCSNETVTLGELIHYFQNRYSDLKVVFIDLFDDIRNVTAKNEYSNIKVFRDIEFLKSISRKYQVAIILLNHDVKNPTGNGYNSTKGGVSLIGKISGSYFHLIKESIGSKFTRIEIGGRNIPEQVMNLEFDDKTLTFQLSDTIESSMDLNIAIIRNYINKIQSFNGTLSELCSRANLTISAAQLGRLLTKYETILNDEGIVFCRSASHKNGRIITIEKSETRTEGTV